MLSLIKDFVCLVGCKFAFTVGSFSDNEFQRGTFEIRYLYTSSHCLLFLDTLLGGLYIIRN